MRIQGLAAMVVNLTLLSVLGLLLGSCGPGSRDHKRLWLEAIDMDIEYYSRAGDHETVKRLWAERQTIERGS